LQYFRKNLRFTRFSLYAGIAVLPALAGCEPAAEAGTSSPPVPATAEARHCGDDGFLTAQLFGSIERTIDWNARQVDCESMLRPRGEGMRLRFTGLAADQEVSFIIAVPDLEQGIDGHELPAVVTLAVEGSGRFFSTANLDTCFADIEARSGSAAAPERYDVSGTLFCVSALGEINGDAAVSIPEMQFQSPVDWSVQ
jgi:hypothetical protein